MSHLIAAHQGRPGDDPIFALNREASERRARGETVVNATVGALLDDAGKLAVLPSAARAVHEVPAVEWAAYAPISGSPGFLRAAACDDLLGRSPALRECAIGRGDARRERRAPPRDQEFPRAGSVAPHDEFLLGSVPDARRRGRPARRHVRDVHREGRRARVRRRRVRSRARRARHRAEARADFLERPVPQPDGLLDERRRVARRARRARNARREGARHGARRRRVRGLRRARLPRVTRAASSGCSSAAQVLFAYSASKSFTHYGLRVGALVACAPDAKERASIAAAFGYSCRGTWSNCVRGGQVADHAPTRRTRICRRR